MQNRKYLKDKEIKSSPQLINKHPLFVDKPVNKYVNCNDFLGLTKKEYEDYQEIISWKET